jgi:hypothetical protein
LVSLSRDDLSFAPIPGAPKLDVIGGIVNMSRCHRDLQGLPVPQARCHAIREVTKRNGKGRHGQIYPDRCLAGGGHRLSYVAGAAYLAAQVAALTGLSFPPASSIFRTESYQEK